MQIIDLSQLRILVVDDNPDLCLVLSAMLECFGARIDTCAFSAEAYARLGQEPFDVVILDVEMPETDSLALLDSIRTHPDPQVSGLTVIALGAHLHREERDRVLTAGCTDWFPKPTNRDQLVLRLQACENALRAAQVARRADQAS